MADPLVPEAASGPLPMHQHAFTERVQWEGHQIMDVSGEGASSSVGVWARGVLPFHPDDVETDLQGRPGPLHDYSQQAGRDQPLGHLFRSVDLQQSPEPRLPGPVVPDRLEMDESHSESPSHLAEAGRAGAGSDQAAGLSLLPEWDFIPDSPHFESPGPSGASPSLTSAASGLSVAGGKAQSLPASLPLGVPPPPVLDFIPDSPTFEQGSADPFPGAMPPSFSTNRVYEDAQLKVDWHQEGGRTVGTVVVKSSGMQYQGDLDLHILPAPFPPTILYHGRGTLVLPDGTQMSGEWRYNALQRGEVRYPNGALAQGAFFPQPGSLQGPGVYVTPGGMRIEGNWQNGQPQGRMRVHFPSVDPLWGGWVAEGSLNANWRLEGLAILREGQSPPIVRLFQDGQKESVSIWIPGDSGGQYFGEVKADHPNGWGALHREEGSIVFGRWKYGEIAQGEVLYPNGRHYRGDLQNLVPHGSGECSDSQGHLLQGSWRDGQWEHPRRQIPAGVFDGALKGQLPDGWGKLYTPDGRVVSGVWIDGELSEGTVLFPDGNRYTGPLDPQSGLPDTQQNPAKWGECTFPDGVKQRCAWRKGVPEGEVQVEFPNGDLSIRQLNGLGQPLPGEKVVTLEGVEVEIDPPAPGKQRRSLIGLFRTEGEMDGGDLIRGREVLSGSGGEVEIEVMDRHSIGRLVAPDAIDRYRLDVAGAVLNRWESIGLQNSERVAIHTLLDDLRTFAEDQTAEWTPQCYPHLTETVNEVMGDFRQNVASELLQVFQQGLVLTADPLLPDQIDPRQQSTPCVLYGKWPGHAITYVIYQDCLYICQRGVVLPAEAASSGGIGKIEPVVSVPFERDQLGPLLKELARLTQSPAQEALTVLYRHSQPQSLAARFGRPASRDSLKDSLPSFTGAVRQQRVGNCQLFSPLSAMICVSGLLMQERMQTEPELKAKVDRVGNWCLTRNIYKAFRQHQKAKTHEALRRTITFDLASPPGWSARALPVSAQQKSVVALILSAEGKELGQAVLQKNGQGEWELDKGGIYHQDLLLRGTFDREGQLHGRGRTQSFRTGEVQVGRFEHGKLEGPGQIITAQGVERGEFRNGQRVG